jgi:hypothetical protein
VITTLCTPSVRCAGRLPAAGSTACRHTCVGVDADVAVVQGFADEPFVDAVVIHPSVITSPVF